MRLAQDQIAQTQARRYARNWASECALAPDVVADIELVVAELVSNAIRHGSAPYEVELCQSDGVIRGKVIDGSPTPPTINPTPDEHGGYGLRVITACTSRWGISTLPIGKQVWFEVDPNA